MTNKTIIIKDWEYDSIDTYRVDDFVWTVIHDSPIIFTVVSISKDFNENFLQNYGNCGWNFNPLEVDKTYFSYDRMITPCNTEEEKEDWEDIIRYNLIEAQKASIIFEKYLTK